jgi:hypothetical protein
VSGRALVLAGLIALAACFSASQRREETLTREARAFNDDLRWARWEAVSSAMPRDEATAFLARVAALEDELVLADYEVTSLTFAPGSNAAAVVARIEWYYNRDPRLHHTVVEQAWEYQHGRWLVTKLRRARGDRFGLVTEPVKPAPGDAGPAAAPDGEPAPTRPE